MIKAHFTEIKALISKSLLEAKESAWIASAYFTDKSILNILCALARAGKDIRLLVSDEPINIQNREIDYNELIDAGGSFYLANRTSLDSLMHHKFCIIDHRYVLTGSYNWTKKAERNRENIVRIEDKSAVSDFENEFAFVESEYCIPVDRWANEKIPSGFVDLDRILDGFHNGELICIGSREAMGATSLACNIAYRASAQHNHQVGFISGDLTDQTMGFRLVSLHSGVALDSMKRNRMDDLDWLKLHAHAQGKDGLPFLFHHETDLASIENKCLAFSYQNVKLIIIDGLLSIRRYAGDPTFQNEQLRVLQRLKALCRKIRIPIIVTTRLEAPKKGGLLHRKPTIEQLEAFEGYFDTILFVHREEFYGLTEDEMGNTTQGVAEIVVAKSYDHITGPTYLKYDKSTLKFEDFEEG